MNGPVAVNVGSFIASSETMMKMPNIDFDDKECYCRMLGHHLSFSYCRSCQEGAPCFKILDCWFDKFDVRKFIEENYAAEEIEGFLKPPKPKVQTLITLIQQAQKSMKNE
jgi:hypothetical protein